jgi:hypothetical protein
MAGCSGYDLVEAGLLGPPYARMGGCDYDMLSSFLAPTVARVVACRMLCGSHAC